MFVWVVCHTWQVATCGNEAASGVLQYLGLSQLWRWSIRIAACMFFLVLCIYLDRFFVRFFLSEETSWEQVLEVPTHVVWKIQSVCPQSSSSSGSRYGLKIWASKQFWASTCGFFSELMWFEKTGGCDGARRYSRICWDSQRAFPSQTGLNLQYHFEYSVISVFFVNILWTLMNIEWNFSVVVPTHVLYISIYILYIIYIIRRKRCFPTRCWPWTAYFVYSAMCWGRGRTRWEANWRINDERRILGWFGVWYFFGLEKTN